MIQIRSLTKSFKGQKVLDDLSMDIPEGKITVVIGPSGTGKSVLLKHILGLLKPDSGSILINGHDITAMNEVQLNGVRQQFGVCFQDAALFDSMNVGENVGFPFVIHTDFPKDKITREVDSLLTEVGLSGIEPKMPSQISGGMRKRVGLARALAMRPRFILFDEPTTGLDPVMSNAINMLIKHIQERTSATSLVISHDIEGAYAIADYMAMLYRGKIVYDGTPEDFKTSADPLVKQFTNGWVEGPINPINPMNGA
jgi:phospholipid/cholesterol/gamma-HCH transport system ATP-binding protein